MRPSENQRWYPTKQQVKERPEETIRQILKQHYDLQDQYDALVAKMNAPTKDSSGPPPGSGPTDSMLLGLRILPIDTTTLADGTKLTWVKASGNFQFK